MDLDWSAFGDVKIIVNFVFLSDWSRLEIYLDVLLISFVTGWKVHKIKSLFALKL